VRPKIAAPKNLGDAMIRIVPIATAIVFYATSALAQSKATIDKLNDAWCAAFNKGDAAAVAAMYTDDATVLPPGAPMVKGATAIKDLWAAQANALGDAKLTTVELHTMGEVMAYEIGTVTAKTKASPPQDVAGKYVVVWRRSGTSWKIAADIFNLDK
jgi:uncharacterized protein (TIGR02246 family)